MGMRKDLLLALIAGLIAGIFLMPTLKTLGAELPYWNFLPLFVLILLPLACVTWIFLIKKIFGGSGSLFQIAKFAVVGGLNASIDFGVLNILIIFTQVASGSYFSLFKALSFIVANINSYFWNRSWTFEGRSQIGTGEYAKFFSVSLGGLLINVAAASIVVNLIGPQFGLSSELWANVGALFASLAGLLWNFLGYKLMVFKR